jgi:uncharacterized protein (UPF0276 family)
MNPTAGLSFKPVHFDEAFTCSAAGMWFEVHAENYMVDGGPRVAMLDALRSEHPLSVHGVGLSLAGAAEPDRDHVLRLKELVERIEPFLVSEHLAWSRQGATCFPDLLPFPRTSEALSLIARNIDIVQDMLGRRILIENPSLYVRLDGHEYAESEFLGELARRTGCGLLIDVNNVFVTANNIGFSPRAYLDALPCQDIGEIHLAGHTLDPQHGRQLLIDSHDEAVSEEVWDLYDWLLARCGAHRPPTLVERDDNLPDFAVLMVERDRAASMLKRHWGMRDAA